MSDLVDLKTFFEVSGAGKSFTRGSTIHTQGDGVSEVHFISSGLVKITDQDRHGNARTIAIFGQGHIVPISWLFINEPEQGALYNYGALANTETLCVSREAIRTALDTSPEIYKYLADATSKAYVNAAARIHNLQKTNVTEKVEFVLYYLATLLGDRQDGQIVTINAQLTHQDIADIAGLSRESVTHLFSKDKYKKVIWKQSGETLIDIGKLDSSNMPPVYGFNL